MLIDTPTRTLADVARDSRIEYHRQRLAGFWGEEKQARNCRPVILNGVRYASAIEASEDTGIHERLIREKCRGIATKYRRTRGQNVPFEFTAAYAKR